MSNTLNYSDDDDDDVVSGFGSWKTLATQQQQATTVTTTATTKTRTKKTHVDFAVSSTKLSAFFDDLPAIASNSSPVSRSIQKDTALSDNGDNDANAISSSSSNEKEIQVVIKKRRVRPTSAKSLVSAVTTQVALTDSQADPDSFFRKKRPSRVQLSSSITDSIEEMRKLAALNAKLYGSSDDEEQQKETNSSPAPDHPKDTPKDNYSSQQTSSSTVEVIDIKDVDVKPEIVELSDSPVEIVDSSEEQKDDLQWAPEDSKFMLADFENYGSDAVGDTEEKIRIKVQNYMNSQPSLAKDPCRFLIRKSDRIKLVVDYYCQENNVAMDSLVFLYKGVKVYSSTTPRGLRMLSNKAVLDAITVENYQQLLKQNEEYRSQSFSESVEDVSSLVQDLDDNNECDQDDETQQGVRIKLILKQTVVELFVSNAFTVARLKVSFLKRSGLPAATKLSLSFDGEVLDDTTTVESLDMEDGDQMDVKLKT